MPLRRMAALAAALALPAACAPRRPPQVAARPAAAADVIIAARLVPPGATRARDAILARLGMPVPAGVVAPHLVEFILRAPSGGTLSVVQDDPRHLRPGMRVALQGAGGSRLQPAVTEVAAAPGD